MLCYTHKCKLALINKKENRNNEEGATLVFHNCLPSLEQVSCSTFSSKCKAVMNSPLPRQSCLKPRYH